NSRKTNGEVRSGTSGDLRLRTIHASAKEIESFGPSSGASAVQSSRLSTHSGKKLDSLVDQLEAVTFVSSMDVSRVTRCDGCRLGSVAQSVKMLSNHGRTAAPSNLSYRKRKAANDP